MPYAVPDDVRGVLAPDLTVPGGTPAELADDTLTERITAAAAQVDASLAARYNVPFPDTAIPRLVKDLTVAIAAYLASLTWRRSVDLTTGDPLVLRYQWATGLLTALSKGEIDLPDIPGTTEPVKQRGATVVQPYDGEMFQLRNFGLAVAPEGLRIRTYRDPGDWGWAE